MKIVPLIVLTFLLTVVADGQTAKNPYLPNPDVQVKYDRFADETSVVGALGSLNDAVPTMRMTLIASYKGQQRAGASEPTVMLVLTSRSNDWEFLKATPILRCILAEKERVTLGEMKRVGSEVIRGGVIEQLGIELPLGTIERLANASMVEMQVWRTEFKLSTAQQQTIKDYVRALRG